MTPAEDLPAVIYAQAMSLVESVGLELGWRGRDHIAAMMTTGANAAGVGPLQAACTAHLDRAVSAIVAAGGGDAELLVRTGLIIFMQEVLAMTAQKEKEKAKA